MIFISSFKEPTRKAGVLNDQDITSKFHIPDSSFVILTYKSDWHWVLRTQNQQKSHKVSSLNENMLIIAYDHRCYQGSSKTNYSNPGTHPLSKYLYEIGEKSSLLS